MSTQVKKKNIGKSAIIIALVALVAIVALVVGGTRNKVFGLVGIDINPSLEVSIDKDYDVIKVEGTNQEGKTFENLKLKGMDLDDAIEKIVAEAELRGYIKNDASDYMMITTVLMKDNPRAEADLLEKIQSDLDINNVNIVIGKTSKEFYKNKGKAPLGVAVIKDKYNKDIKTIREFFENEDNINLLMGDPDETLKLKKNLANTGEVADRKITKEEAIQIAMNHKSLQAEDILSIKAEYDMGDNEYEIEIISGNTEYNYEIDASTGKIVDIDIDYYGDSNKSENSANIKRAQAIQIALDDSKLTKEEVKRIKTEFDFVDNEYEIEIKTGEKEYEYEIDAKSGKIKSKEVKTTLKTNNYSRNITRKQAEEIALKDLNMTDIRSIESEYDDDDNEYEVEIKVLDNEYDYKIDAATGDIKEKKVEKSDDLKLNDKINNIKDKIGKDRALEIALKDAGLKIEEITKKDVDFDLSDNEYEVEFDTRTNEYDYIIDASSGAIKKKEVEKSDDLKLNDKINNIKDKIGKDRALDIAIKDAGLSNADLVKKEVDFDLSDNEYEVELKTSNKEYDYKIDASTGKIKEKEVDNR